MKIAKKKIRSVYHQMQACDKIGPPSTKRRIFTVTRHVIYKQQLLLLDITAERSPIARSHLAVGWRDLVIFIN